MKLKSFGWQCNKKSLQSGVNLAWIGCAKQGWRGFLAFAFHLPTTLTVDLRFDFLW